MTETTKKLPTEYTIAYRNWTPSETDEWLALGRLLRVHRGKVGLSEIRAIIVQKCAYPPETPKAEGLNDG